MKTKFFMLMALFVKTAYAIPATAIIGGENFSDTQPAYAALLAPDATLTQLSSEGFPSTSGIIQSVAINSSGSAIIGGENFIAGAYAALVAPNGTLTQLSGGGLPAPSGKINSVAINSSGLSLIGGGSFSGMLPAYAALVTPDGSLMPLSGGGFPSTSGFINSVAINDSGEGLIGGVNETFPSPAYAALVAPNGTLTQLSGSGFPSTTGSILSVAINSSGVGVIGGQNLVAPNPAYAALVASNGTLTQLSGGAFPSTSGTIFSVAINSSGVGLIGGEDGTGTQPAYAALVAPNGTLTQLSGEGFPSTTGRISSVAINSSGVGLIGGQDLDLTGTQPAYAALVAPNGTLTKLSGDGFPSTSGNIRSVAINPAGVAIIGGEDITGSNPAYVALVAPNGILTQLRGAGFPSTDGEIFSVAIADTATPLSIGPYTSVMNMQLAATYALETHLIEQSRHWIRGEPQNMETALLASSDSSVRGGIGLQRKQPAPSYTLWGAPFGDYVHQKGENEIPTFTNDIAGMLVGFDFQMKNGLAGFGLGYAFNYVHYGQSQGHGIINEEMVSAYGLYRWSHCWVNGVLWGGSYQLYNERHTLPPMITSTVHTHGWVFSPHVEVAAPFEWSAMKWFTIEPFVMFDWVNNWQSSFTEQGRSGFNLVMKDHYDSLLRSEAGLRFYELLYYDWGRLLFEEKASYVNQAPFQFNKTTTFFVASASTFPIAIGSTDLQNLGGVELRAAFLPWNQKMPYGALSFQGEFGSSYQSYFGNVEIGKNF